MADSDAVRAQRYRQHRQNDHSLCKPGCAGRRLSAVPDGTTLPTLPEDVQRLEEAVRAELGEHDPLVLALALRLVRLSASTGPAAVGAVKNLAELVAAQRGGAR